MKKIWIEYLRALSIIAVIIIHSTSSVYKDFGNIQVYSWWLANLLNTLSRFSVPIFVMISGCVLLGRDIDIQKFYKKRGSRLLPALLFWSLFYITFDSVFNNRSLNTVLWNLTVGLIFSGKAYHHLWYLSMFICLMLFVPFINNYITGKKPTLKDFFYMFLTFTLFLLLNQISITGNELFEVDMTWFKLFPWYIGYFIMGYFIDTYNDKIAIKNSTTIALIGAILTISCILNFYSASSLDIIKDSFILNNKGILNFLLSISIFYLFSKNRAKFRENSFVFNVSSKSFGIYLIHPLFITIFKKYIEFYLDSSIITMTLLMIMTFICSLLSITILTRLKWFKTVC